jgi:abortive infection bacteriophage resistance protein
MDYVKPWLSNGEQIEKLASKGVRIGDGGVAGAVLREVGYYRLTGYLYPFRESSFVIDVDGGLRNDVAPGSPASSASRPRRRC